MRPALFRILALACAIGALSLPCSARAGEPVSRAAIHADLLSYYGGEATAARIVGVLGLVAAGSGAFLLTRRSELAHGMAWPLFGFGLLEGIGAIIYSFQVSGEIDRYQALLSKDPAGFREVELSHIGGTMDRFVYYRIIELALAVGGAATLIYGAASHHPLAEGIGTGLIAIGLPFFVIDTFNNNRAHGYAEDLRAFSPTMALRARHPVWMVAVSGTF